LWLTGLSSSGKTTLSMAVEKELFERGYKSYVLDGDNLRNGLNTDLTFVPEDRSENIRRVAEVAALFADAGIITIVSLISPFKSDRMRAKSIIKNSFYEVAINASIDVCKKRDVKGLYKKAQSGEVKNFTGITSPYETPEYPSLLIDTENKSIKECVNQIVLFIQKEFDLTQ